MLIFHGCRYPFQVISGCPGYTPLFNYNALWESGIRNSSKWIHQGSIFNVLNRFGIQICPTPDTRTQHLTPRIPIHLHRMCLRWPPASTCGRCGQLSGIHSRIADPVSSGENERRTYSILRLYVWLQICVDERIYGSDIFKVFFKCNQQM